MIQVVEIALPDGHRHRRFLLENYTGVRVIHECGIAEPAIVAAAAAVANAVLSAIDLRMRELPMMSSSAVLEELGCIPRRR